MHQFQRLVVDKLSYRFHQPQRDDIVVLDLPGVSEMLVKRVAGLPGETIEIHEGVIYIDGIAQSDPYPHDMAAYEMEPLTLPPLYYFVLGDNRSNVKIEPGNSIPFMVVFSGLPDDLEEFTIEVIESTTLK